MSEAERIVGGQKVLPEETDCSQLASSSVAGFKRAQQAWAELIREWLQIL